MMIEKNSVIEENSSKVSCAYEDKMGNTTNNDCFEQNINVVNIEMEKKSPLEYFCHLFYCYGN